MERLELLEDHLNTLRTTVTTPAIRDQLKVTIKDKVALIKLNPPTKLIFMNRTLVGQLSDEIEYQEKNFDVNVIVITGKDNSFATGADINELHSSGLREQLYSDYFDRLWYRIIPKVRKPLIAAVNGFCFGGGFEIALMCDIVVASDNA